jgi:predicted small secreted protein
MKKLSVLLTVLVLTISMLTGCGCTRRGAGMDTMPATEMTILPTNIPETTVPTMPATEPMTDPVTEPTDNTDTMSTEDGGITDSITGETGTRSRIR